MRVLNQGLFQSLRSHLCPLWSHNRAPMGHVAPSLSVSLRWFSHLGAVSETSHLQRNGILDLGTNKKSISRSTPLNIAASLNWRDSGVGRSDEAGKAHVLALNQQFLQEIEIISSAKKLNEHVTGINGKPLGIPNHSPFEKLVVAVDVDEVLGSFLSALNKFIADRYSLKHTLSEYYVYEFFRIWNCSRKEADLRVHEFFRTPYFQDGIHPIPGARDALERLSSFCSLSVVTSRQNAIKENTLKWIDMHYPGLFGEIHFGNHFALDGQSRPKSEICRSLGAHVLIDDNPRYALECANVGIQVLLFDYEDAYPWCKTGLEHPLVTKVRNWSEVEQKLFAWKAA